MYFLHHTTELGFSFHNRGLITMSQGEAGGSVLENHLKQIPEITEIANASEWTTLLPQGGRMSYSIPSWDDKPADVENVNVEYIYAPSEYFRFYNLQLVAGEMLTDDDPEAFVVINESVVSAFGWDNPVGQQFVSEYMPFDGKYVVKGVIKNIYNFAPTVPTKAIVFLKPLHFNTYYSKIMFRFQAGMWKSCKLRIEQMIKNEFPGVNAGLTNSEEEYDKYLQSENVLVKLLSFVSAVCVLICIFGFVSLVLLTCEERRKEIAIRKINGATISDILAIFTKEYALLLLIGAVIAFTTGYYIMHRWLEQYVKQTSIAVWVYLSILCVMALVIVVCVGWQVYKASAENPADVVKNSF
jgi:hypothetical protein